MTPIEAAAGDAVLVGDPRRAFALAQELMVQPKMSHQARGLWGYTGLTADGRPLTVQATGVGGSSAVPVIGDLAAQGVSRMLRLGTCLAIDDSLGAGALLLVERAVVADGAGRLLSDGAGFVRPDPQLADALEGLGRTATISSHDLVERYEPEGSGRPDPGPAVARDLQTAATLAMCGRLGLPSAALLIVAEDHSGERLGEEDLWDLFRSAGSAALGRLARSKPAGTPAQPDI
jgi:uridine phosphorylase